MHRLSDQSLSRSLITRIDVANARTCGGFAWMARYQPQSVPAATVNQVARKEVFRQDLLARILTQWADVTVIPKEPLAVARTATKTALANGAPHIAGATFQTPDGLIATFDLLSRHGNQFTIHDVRTTTGLRTEHLVDTAYQLIVAEAAGLRVTAVEVWSLRKDYVRNGTLDLADACVHEDVLPKVRSHIQRVKTDIERAASCLADPERPAPCLCDMGTRSQRCPTFEAFHPDIPYGGTVYDLGGASAEVIGKVLERGVTRLADWPDDIRVSARQRTQIEIARAGEPLFDHERVAAFLSGLAYPLYLLDYETFQSALPLYDASKPWAHVPFQYSVHVVHADGQVEHRGLLWRQRGNPVPAIVSGLQEVIGEVGSVVVWNRGFERSRNLEMAAMLPDAAPFLENLNERIVDLMDVVKLGMWLHPAFNGSASIKKVLPVAAPDLSYRDLAIGDGAYASERWYDAVMGDPGLMSEREREAIMAALEEYCHLDTLAMLRILDHLSTEVSEATPASIS